MASGCCAQLTAAACLMLLYRMETGQICNREPSCSPQRPKGRCDTVMAESCLPVVISGVQTAMKAVSWSTELTVAVARALWRLSEVWHINIFGQLRQQVLMLMTEMMARVQKLTDIVYLQQQLLLSAHCVLGALHKQGPFDANKALQQICTETLVSVSYADAHKGPDFSANAVIGFPVDTWEEVSPGIALNSTLTLLLEHDKQLFWTKAFPTCFDYFQDIVGREMARCDAPDSENIELLSVEQYVNVLSKFRDHFDPTQVPEAGTSSPTQAAELILQSLFLTLKKTVTVQVVLTCSQKAVQEHMEAGNLVHVHTVAPKSSLKCPTGMVMTSHNACLSPLYLAQSKAASMQKALRRCTCSIDYILCALHELFEDPHWVYMFNTLLPAHQGSSSSGTSCTAMHSCLAQLTHTETLSAEVIKELEDFLRVPKDVTPPLTVIEKHLAEEEEAQANAKAAKERRRQAERDRRAAQQQRKSHSASLTEQTAGAAAVASDSHHVTLSREHKRLSAHDTAGRCAYQTADAGHSAGPSTPDATEKLHSLCISPPEGPQESQAVHTAAPCKLFCCPLTKGEMRDPVLAADGHSYEREAIEL